MHRSLSVLLLTILFVPLASAQNLSVKWGELTAPDFVQALEQAGGVCMLPFGVIEKHGPAGPLGTDLLNVRYATVAAAEREYAIVFPEYYFGQIFEAEHQPGTISYSRKLQLDLLQETVSEMGRNGCTKVVIVNGHGGNSPARPAAEAWADRRDGVELRWHDWWQAPEVRTAIDAMTGSPVNSDWPRNSISPPVDASTSAGLGSTARTRGSGDG